MGAAATRAISARGNEIGSGRKRRGRHLLSHPDLLGGDADEMDEPGGNAANYLEQEGSEPRQRVISPSEDSHIGPGIEIMLNRQQEKVLLSAPAAKLTTIGVLFPADAAQQFPIGGMESNQVAAAAVVRAEDKLLRRQLRERALDVARPKPRAIPADSDNFLIAKLRDSFDRALKPRREVPPHLTMNM